jgi:hypothetical protein
MQTEMRTLPIYWASYLINGDASSLEVEEVQEIEDFLSREGLDSPIDIAEFGGFQWMNDANGIAGEVADYIFIIN